MSEFLGETIIAQENSPFSDYTKEDWVMHFIEAYGDIDGGNHKQWVLDQIVRIIKGTDIVIKKAEWDDGRYEYRILTADEPSDEYKEWEDSWNYQDPDQPEIYTVDVWDKGIAP